MPAYPYLCERGHGFDLFFHMDEEKPEVTECPADRGSARRDYATQFRSQARRIFQPFTDTHLTGKPVEITSREQHERLMKSSGVRLQESEEWPEKMGFNSQYHPPTIYSLPVGSSTTPTRPESSPTPEASTS